MTGSYDLVAGTGMIVSHGFHMRRGSYATWDVPGAEDTRIQAANETGRVTGCFTRSGKTHGFLDTP